MIAGKKRLTAGLALVIGMLYIGFALFFPVFEGKTFLQHFTKKYRALSKHSADFMKDLKPKAVAHVGQTVTLSLSMNDPEQAERIAVLFHKSSVRATPFGSILMVEGDLGHILQNCLADAQALYLNQNDALMGKYVMEGQSVLLFWSQSLQKMNEDLKKQNRFKQADTVSLIRKKAVEPANKYYGITPQALSDNLGFVLLSFIFYLACALWLGLAILFLFEGWGQKDRRD